MSLGENVEHLMAALTSWPATTEAKNVELEHLETLLLRLKNLNRTPSLEAHDLESHYEEINAVIAPLVTAEWTDKISAFARESEGLSNALDEMSATLAEECDKLQSLDEAELEKIEALAEEAKSTLYNLADLCEARVMEFEQSACPPLDQAETAAQEIVENIIDRTKDLFTDTFSFIADKEFEAKQVLDRAKMILVQDLQGIESSVHRRLQDALEDIRARAEGAIKEKTIKLVERELTEATDAILQGQSLQLALSAGPWIAGIRAAKIAMEHLP